MHIKLFTLSILLVLTSLINLHSQQTPAALSVGYINQSIPVGLSMIANQLNSFTNNNLITLFGKPTLVDVAPGAPGNITVYSFNGTGYDGLTYDLENGWTGQTNMSLNLGGGVFIDNASGAPLVITFKGKVQNNSTNVITAGQGIYSSVIPQSLSVNLLNLPTPSVSVATLNVNFYNALTGIYHGYTYETEQGGWLPFIPTPLIGESFFIDWADSDSNGNHIGSLSWTRNFVP